MFSWLLVYFVLTRNFQEKRLRISKNILTQISVKSNRPFRGLLSETKGAGLHVSQWKILIRNKTMTYKNCYKENPNI